jgi:hypothetical protein
VLHCSPPLWHLTNSTSSSSNSSSDVVTRLTRGPGPRTLMAMHDDGTLVLHTLDSTGTTAATGTATDTLSTTASGTTCAGAAAATAGARGSAVWQLNASPPPTAVTLHSDSPLSPPKGPSALPPARPLCFAVLPLLQDSCSSTQQQQQQQQGAVAVGYSNGAVAVFSVGYCRSSLSVTAATAAKATVSFAEYIESSIIVCLHTLCLLL